MKFADKIAGDEGEASSNVSTNVGVAPLAPGIITLIHIGEAFCQVDPARQTLFIPADQRCVSEIQTINNILVFRRRKLKIA